MDQSIKEIRHYLHKHPDLPGQEDNTATYVTELLKQTAPDELMTEVGGKGIIAFYKGAKPGKSIAFRAELDALPISETNHLPYNSINEGVAHSCGHDGHMAIAIGIASYVAGIRDKLKGSVAVIFQPEEETGTGAEKMLADKRLHKLHFDTLLALHNLPGFEKNSLIVRKGVFTSTTTGMIIRLYGATSHAGQPENGNSPVQAMIAIIHSLQNIPQVYLPVHRSALVTIIHARLGEIAFGTTPGYAHVMATMRAHEPEDLEIMKEKALKITEGISTAYLLKCETEWVESYPAVINEENITEEIIKTGEKLGLPIIHRDYPFSWSEDFSHFVKRYTGVLFGLGSGIETPQLHNDDYDFPDDLLETGIDIFTDIINKLMVK